MLIEKPRLRRHRKSIDYVPTDRFEWWCWARMDYDGWVIGTGETPHVAYYNAMAEVAFLERLDREQVAAAKRDRPGSV